MCPSFRKLDPVFITACQFSVEVLQGLPLLGRCESSPEISFTSHWPPNYYELSSKARPKSVINIFTLQVSCAVSLNHIFNMGGFAVIGTPGGAKKQIQRLFQKLYLYISCMFSSTLQPRDKIHIILVFRWANPLQYQIG